jgi:hypothetical protein
MQIMWHAWKIEMHAEFLVHKYERKEHLDDIGHVLLE